LWGAGRGSIIEAVAEEIPYREPGTPRAGKITGKALVIIGLIILGVAIVLMVLPMLVELGMLKAYSLVIGFGLACFGASLMLHGAIDWAKGG
jgi:hypothetical protein